MRKAHKLTGGKIAVGAQCLIDHSLCRRLIEFRQVTQLTGAQILPTSFVTYWPAAARFEGSINCGMDRSKSPSFEVPRNKRLRMPQEEKTVGKVQEFLESNMRDGQPLADGAC